MTNNITLQEIITRGRFIFANSPRKLELFKLINGKRTIEDFASETGRDIHNIYRDLKTIYNMGLIEPINEETDGAIVYDKIPVACEIPTKYFVDEKPLIRKEPISILGGSSSTKHVPILSMPTENEVLDIAKKGETQLYEFKSDDTEASKITREVAAFLHTRQGGIVLVGIDDEGDIEGCSAKLQVFDQAMQNSVRNSINPPPIITINEVKVLGYKIFGVIIKPWNKETVYQYNEKVLIRKGTNAFAVKPDELRKLMNGEYLT